MDQGLLIWFSLTAFTLIILWLLYQERKNEGSNLHSGKHKG